VCVKRCIFETENKVAGIIFFGEKKTAAKLFIFYLFEIFRKYLYVNYQPHCYANQSGLQFKFFFTKAQ
jgi:hypothetical protein